MKKSFIATFVFLFSALCVFAEFERTPEICVSAPAEKIAETLPPVKDIAGKFSQKKKLSGLDVVLKSSGEFAFSKNGIVWQTLRPTKSTIKIDSEAIRFFDRADKLTREIKTSGNAKAQEISAIIRDALLGDYANIENFFELRLGGDKNSWCVRLSAKPEAKGIPLLEISIFGNAKSAREVFLKDKSGDETEIVFVAE